MNKTKVVVIGCEYSTLLLSEAILTKGLEISLLVTLNEDNSYKKVRWISLRKFAKDNSIPLLEVNNMGEVEDYLNNKNLEFDILYEVGWSYLIPKTVFSRAKLGAFGFHPSLLPQGKGTGLIGAVLDNYSKWGSSIFRLEENFDDGEVICHSEFNILIEDNISTLYNKAEASYIELFNKTLEQILTQEFISFENRMIESRYPPRRPPDGEINLTRSNTSIKLYNFIRAQSHPYPGAFIVINEKKLYIWSAQYNEINDKIVINRVQYENEAEFWFEEFEDKELVINKLRSFIL